jgi:hypothetical protein
VLVKCLVDIVYRGRQDINRAMIDMAKALVYNI